MPRILLLLIPWVLGACSAAGPPRIGIADDGRSFVRAGEPFTPWGFNYDHDRESRLIEDYWHDEWATVEQDFAEMRALGANVVRVHLQFGRFMSSPAEPNERELDRLAALVDLAERTGLYLDITGLGCYHKQDVPAWYDALDESARWRAQASFWSAIARRLDAHPAIFCYDLMNEPVVPGGDKPSTDWLGPGFGGKHFVQRIALDRAGRERAAIANAWIDTLADAIREHDNKTLITVGMVPWSLDRPGLTSGFDPTKVARRLDFIAVHLYPESAKPDEAMTTLAGFDVGKPIVIEEIFPLMASPAATLAFIERSREHACGWISFYWGKTIDEYRNEKTIAAAIMRDWLARFADRAGAHSAGR